MLKRRKEYGTHLATARRLPAESYILFIILHRHLYSPAMSKGSSQIGTALFLSFLIIHIIVQNNTYYSARSKWTKQQHELLTARWGLPKELESTTRHKNLNIMQL